MNQDTGRRALASPIFEVSWPYTFRLNISKTWVHDGAKRTCTVQRTDFTLLLPPTEYAQETWWEDTKACSMAQGKQHLRSVSQWLCISCSQKVKWKMQFCSGAGGRGSSSSEGSGRYEMKLHGRVLLPRFHPFSCSDPRGAGQGAHATAVVNSSASKGTSQSWMNWSKTLLSFPPQFLPDLEKQSCSLRLTDSQANFYMWFGKNKLLDMS